MTAPTPPDLTAMPSVAKPPAPAPPPGLTDGLLDRWEAFWAQPEAGRLGPLGTAAVSRLFCYTLEWESLRPAPGIHMGLTWAEVFKLEVAISRLEARIGRSLGC